MIMKIERSEMMSERDEWWPKKEQGCSPELSLRQPSGFFNRSIFAFNGGSLREGRRPRCCPHWGPHHVSPCSPPLSPLSHFWWTGFCLFSLITYWKCFLLLGYVEEWRKISSFASGSVWFWLWSSGHVEFGQGLSWILQVILISDNEVWGYIIVFSWNGNEFFEKEDGFCIYLLDPSDLVHLINNISYTLD